MNAPANIRVARPVSVDPTPEERAYAATISIHCPNCDEMEMAARCDIAMMRDLAIRGAVKATASAAIMLGEVARIATSAVYAPLPASQLIRIRSALNLSMEAARAVERVQRDG